MWSFFSRRARAQAAQISVRVVAPRDAVIEQAWSLGGQLPPLAAENLPVAVLLPGDQRAQRLGQGMDFELLRAYQPGEPAQLIDWRISARTPQPMVRIYREPAQRQCHIVLDTGGSMFFGTRRQLKITQALTVAHLLTAAALHQNLAVSLHTPGLSARPARHPSTSRAALLNQLREIGVLLDSPAASQPIDWTGFRQRLQSSLAPGQLLVVIGDFQADFAEDRSLMGWLPLAQQHRLMLLPVADPAEQSLPDLGVATFAATPPKRPQRLDTHDPGVRAELAARFAERQRAIAELSLAVGGLTDLIETTTELAGLLPRFAHLLLTGQGARAA